MFTLLWEHPLLTGAAGLALAAFVAVGLFGGWPLVLNRYVLGALAVILGAVAGALWWEATKAHWQAEGAAALEQANLQASNERRALVLTHEQEQRDRDKQYAKDLATGIGKVRAEAAARERSRNVSAKADAACIIPLGFVRDHNAAVPGPAGLAEIPAAAGDNPDRPTGVVLSAAGRCIDANYTRCAEIQLRLAACEEQRYAACVAWDKQWGTSSGCAR